MYLLDESGSPVDSEFSLDLIDGDHCIVVESSGGAAPNRGIKRRNPDYNKLVSLLFTRLAVANVRVTRIILDSDKVQDFALSERVVALGISYPIDLRSVSIEKLRIVIGRSTAAMHRDPSAAGTGNVQKRIRICIARALSPEQLQFTSDESVPIEIEVPYPNSVTATERERLAAARLGQGLFRKALFDRWGDVCPVLGIAHTALLVASHIKPWKVCTNDERLDPENGILLSAMLDKLFDNGLITFSEDGRIVVSPQLLDADQALCGLSVVRPLSFSMRGKRYLSYHQTIVFKSV